MIRSVPAVCLCAMLSACASRPATPTASLLPALGRPAGPAELSASDLRGQFGAPSFVRKENGAELWRYDGAGCRAFFFLYADGASQVVRYVETSPRGATTAADANCLAALHAHPPGS